MQLSRQALSNTNRSHHFQIPTRPIITDKDLARDCLTYPPAHPPKVTPPTQPINQPPRSPETAVLPSFLTSHNLFDIMLSLVCRRWQ